MIRNLFRFLTVLDWPLSLIVFQRSGNATANKFNVVVGQPSFAEPPLVLGQGQVPAPNPSRRTEYRHGSARTAGRTQCSPPVALHFHCVSSVATAEAGKDRRAHGAAKLVKVGRLCRSPRTATSRETSCGQGISSNRDRDQLSLHFAM